MGNCCKNKQKQLNDEQVKNVTGGACPCGAVAATTDNACPTAVTPTMNSNVTSPSPSAAGTTTDAWTYDYAVNPDKTSSPK